MHSFVPQAALLARLGQGLPALDSRSPPSSLTSDD